MSHIYSSDLLVKKSIAAVTGPLKDGLCSINRVYKTLIDGDVDPISGQYSNYNYIREQIVQAQQSLKESEHMASTELKSLDDNIETLTQDEGKLEQEMSDTKRNLDNLRTKKTCNENLLRESEGALELAKRNLNSTRDTLQREKERRGHAEVVTDVGAGLFVIPVVGWIAGSVMVATGAAELHQASDAIRVAEQEVSNFKSQAEIYRRKVSVYESKIRQIEHDIRQKHDKVQKIHEEIQKVKEQRGAVAEFQEKVRRVVHILSVLSGKIRVAESQTRRFILQKPVMKVMEDLMKAAADIAGNQLLCNKDILRLADAMKENNRKLAAICDSTNDADDKGY